MSSSAVSVVTKENAKMASIEAARAIAATIVVLMHAANLMRVEHFSGHVGMGNVFDFGYVGVDFFFVLSGFIITYIHYGEIGRPQMMARYLYRRFSRIFPIYWFVLLLSIAVVTLSRLASGASAGFEIGTGDIGSTVFLLVGDGEPKYVGVAWSLQYEVLFYVVFCLLFVHARLGAVLFVVWGAYILLHAAGWSPGELPLRLSHPHCFQFLAGVAVGALARRTAYRVHPRMLWVAVLAFCAATVFEVYGPFERHSGVGRIVLGLAAALVIATLIGLERQRQISTPKWLARMGSVSYSIYLAHVLFITSFYAVLLKLHLYHALPEALVYGLALAVALTATCLLGAFVELPLVGALKERFFSRAGVRARQAA